MACFVWKYIEGIFSEEDNVSGSCLPYAIIFLPYWLHNSPPQAGGSDTSTLPSNYALETLRHCSTTVRYQFPRTWSGHTIRIMGLFYVQTSKIMGQIDSSSRRGCDEVQWSSSGRLCCNMWCLIINCSAQEKTKWNLITMQINAKGKRRRVVWWWFVAFN